MKSRRTARELERAIDRIEEGGSMEHGCADTDLKEYVAAAVLRSPFFPELER